MEEQVLSVTQMYHQLLSQKTNLATSNQVLLFLFSNFKSKFIYRFLKKKSMKKYDKKV